MTRPASRLVLGTVQLGTVYGVANRIGRPSRQQAIAMLRRADEAGVAGFDSAPGYGDSEELLGLAGVRAPIFTKVQADADPRASVDRSLQCLARTSVELLFLHDPQLVVDDPTGAIDRAFELVGRQVGGLGASVYTPEQFEAALADGRISAIQAPVSAADHRLEDAGLLRAALTAGKPVFARSAFLQGALLMAQDELPPHLASLRELITRGREVAAERDEPLSATLTSYVRDLPGIAAVIVGCESTPQLEENLRAVSAPVLSEEHRHALRSAAALPAEVVDPRGWPAPGPR